MKTIKQLLFLIIPIFLAGCGFHLRGAHPLPPQLHTMYLQSTKPYSDLTKQVKMTLAISNVKLVDDPTKAPIILSLSNENFSTYQTSVGNSTQTRNYNATYAVTYQLQNKYGSDITAAKTISNSSTITVNQNEILENSNKLNIAKQNLIRDLVMKLMFQLSSKHTIIALKKHAIIKHENSR
jgi:LPS-assembly lipoprotein